VFSAADWAAFTAASDADPASLAQALISVRYFKKFPREIDIAVGAALALCADMLGACESRGARALFLYIPSRFEIERAEAALEARKAMRLLGLDLADLENADAIADRFVEGLHALGAPVVDLRTSFRQSREPLYWKRDLHLDLAAHELIAREIAPWVQRLAERR
jgi:hypothetical protein